MEKDLAARLLANATSKNEAALGQLGAYAEAAIAAGIAGHKEQCDFFAKAHFAADVRQSRVSEWTRAMEFGHDFKAVETLTMQMVDQVREAGVNCHIHNTANSVLTMFAKSKKENTPAPNAAAMDVKIAARLKSAGLSAAKKLTDAATFDAMTKPAQLASKVKADEILDTINGLLEVLAANKWTGIAAVQSAMDGIAKPVVVAPVAAPTPATPAPEAGTADLAAQMATMQATMQANMQETMQETMQENMNAMAALIAGKQ